jgi:hypothetical protein
MYIPWNWKCGSALSKLRNFLVGGGNPNPLPPRYATGNFRVKFDQRFPLFLVEYLAAFDTSFYGVLCSLLQISSYLMAAFYNTVLDVHWKIYFDQTVAIDNNYSFLKVLII